jgi:ATP-dependent helicase YprA (DUF1998 family)
MSPTSCADYAGCAPTVDLPPTRLVTRGFWYSFDEDVLHRAGVSPAAWPGALHALEVVLGLRL